VDSIAGGLGTPIGIVILVLLARDRTVMSARPISRRLAAAGWTVAVAVGGFGVLYVVGTLAGWL
jgi:Mn2+/Fe2+ NRAMP family transporter